MSSHFPLPPRRSYTADDLLLLARRQGFQATRRLLLDWASQGLLDRPQRQGLGRGKGTRTVWSQAQAELWLALLGHHQHDGVRSIRELCDVPVARWLYYGDEGGVSLAQVQRAMATWIAAYQRTPYGVMLSTARALVARTADPAARREDIQALIDALVGVLCRAGRRTLGSCMTCVWQ